MYMDGLAQIVVLDVIMDKRNSQPSRRDNACIQGWNIKSHYMVIHQSDSARVYHKVSVLNENQNNDMHKERSWFPVWPALFYTLYIVTPIASWTNLDFLMKGKKLLFADVTC